MDTPAVGILTVKPRNLHNPTIDADINAPDTILLECYITMRSYQTPGVNSMLTMFHVRQEMSLEFMVESRWHSVACLS